MSSSMEQLASRRLISRAAAQVKKLATKVKKAFAKMIFEAQTIGSVIKERKDNFDAHARKHIAKNHTTIGFKEAGTTHAKANAGENMAFELLRYGNR